MSNGLPRQSIGWKKSFILAWDAKRMKICGKALGVSWWNRVPRKVLRPKPSGPAPLGFWPWDLLRHNIHHDTSSAFSNNVPVLHSFIRLIKIGPYLTETVFTPTPKSLHLNVRYLSIFFMSMRASLLYSLILRYSLVSADCKLNFRFIPGQTNKSSDNGESSKHKLFRLVVQSVSIYAIGWRQSLQPTRQSWTRFLSRYCGNFSFSARVRCFEVTHIVVSI